MSRWVEITLRHAGFIVQQLTGFFRYATLPLSSGICVTQRFFFCFTGWFRQVSERDVTEGFFRYAPAHFFRYAMNDLSRR